MENFHFFTHKLSVSVAQCGPQVFSAANLGIKTSILKAHFAPTLGLSTAYITNKMGLGNELSSETRRETIGAHIHCVPLKVIANKRGMCYGTGKYYWLAFDYVANCMKQK